MSNVSVRPRPHYRFWRNGGQQALYTAIGQTAAYVGLYFKSIHQEFFHWVYLKCVPCGVNRNLIYWGGERTNNRTDNASCSYSKRWEWTQQGVCRSCVHIRSADKNLYKVTYFAMCILSQTLTGILFFLFPIQDWIKWFAFVGCCGKYSFSSCCPNPFISFIIHGHSISYRGETIGKRGDNEGRCCSSTELYHLFLMGNLLKFTWSEGILLFPSGLLSLHREEFWKSLKF